MVVGGIAAGAGSAAAPITVATSNDAEAGGSPNSRADHPGAVTSPMVGTAFRSAEPTAPAFVEVGSQVAEGDVLLIIEAMKTFNEIPAPCAGTVKEILFENQSPVEFGAVLMIIE